MCRQQPGEHAKEKKASLAGPFPFGFISQRRQSAGRGFGMALFSFYIGNDVILYGPGPPGGQRLKKARFPLGDGPGFDVPHIS
jgi:hypothetical protein